MIRDSGVFDRFGELMRCQYAPHANRRTFASVADAVGLGYLTVKRMLNHAFEGGVTGGYIVPGFNPQKERVNFQKVCDFILDCRAEFLGEQKRKGASFRQEEALPKLERYAIELGLDLESALAALMHQKKSVA